MSIFNFFKQNKSKSLSEKDLRWNRFIEEICQNKDLSELSGVRRNAWLCFWYDAEINNSGHPSFFDCFGEINPQEMTNALF